MKPPFAHRVKKPFRYTSAAETDVARTIREARKALKAAEDVAEEEAAKGKPTNVQALKKERQAA